MIADFRARVWKSIQGVELLFVLGFLTLSGLLIMHRFSGYSFFVFAGNEERMGFLFVVFMFSKNM